jgi:MATE family multidrug resistance protein
VSEPITHRRVLKIALPIVLSNATVPLLGAVDTGVVGQLGQAAPIAAVGMGSVILLTFYWIFGFLRMGTSGLAAQAHGARDEDEGGAILIRALLVGLAAGLGCVLLQGPLFAAALTLAPATDEVERLTRAYLTIRVWGAPATIALYAINGWLIGRERTYGIVLSQVGMNSLNILLSVWFVLFLDWGVQGVAAATLIAEWSGLLVGLLLCRDGFLGGQWRDAARIFNRARLVRMASVNQDILIRSVILQGAFTSFVFLGAGFGEVTQAANQVLLQFLEITAFALDGFAFAAESLVGQAVGARSVAALRRSALLTSQWGAGGAVGLGLAFWFGGPALIDLLTTEPFVRAGARDWLPWVALAPVIGITCWMLDGIFIGATRTRDMRNAMLVTLIAYVPAVVLLPMLWGNHGLWLALMVLLVMRAVTLGRLYPRIEHGLAG